MKAKKIMAVIVSLCTMLGGIGANAATSTLNGVETERYEVTAEQGTDRWITDTNNRFGISDGKFIMKRIASPMGGATGCSNYIATLDGFVTQDAYKITAGGLRKTYSNNNELGVAFNMASSNKNGYYACMKNDGIYLYRFNETKVAFCEISKEGVDLNSDYVDMEIYVLPDKLVYDKNNKGGRIIVYYTVRDNQNPELVLIPRSLAFEYYDQDLLNKTVDKQVGWYAHIRVAAEMDKLTIEDIPYQMIDYTITKDGTKVECSNDLSAGDKVDITARILNENKDIPEGIFAAFGQDYYLNTYMTAAERNSESMNTYTINDFVVPDGITNIEAFFWNSMSGMTPLINKQNILKPKTVTATVNVSLEQ